MLSSPKSRDGDSLGRSHKDPPADSGEDDSRKESLLHATSTKRKIPKAEGIHLNGDENDTQRLFSLSLLPTDDGPYSKGGKDTGGADVALACRRQSIPGNEPPLLPLSLSWRHTELWVGFRQHRLCC